jgi:outer membrane protein assembly complex protein YaeT
VATGLHGGRPLNEGSLAKLPRRLAWLAAVLAGLILIGLGVLHLPSVRGRVLDRVRSYAERELGLNLRASGLSYNLFTRSIELRDVSIVPTSAADPLFEADRIVVVLDAGILQGRIAPSRISVTRPRVTLVRYADGTMNLPTSRKDAGQSSPLELGVVSVSGLSVRVDDRLAQRSFAIGPLDLSVDTSSTSSQPGAFGPGPFTAGAGGYQTSGTLAGRLGFDGSRVRIEEVTVETKEGRAALTGWADVIGERPAVSAHVTATIDLPQAARFARVDVRGLAGRVEATADVSGALADPAIALTIASRDTSIDPVGALRVAGRSSISGSRALIENVDVQSAAGSLQLQGAIELGESAPRTDGSSSRLALRWTDARIDDLARAFGQSLPIPTGSLASGSSTVEFDLRDLQARAWSRLRAAATTTLQAAAAVSSPQSLALSGKADLQAAEGRWSLRHALQAQRAQIDLEGTVTGTLTDGGDVLRSTVGGGTRVRVPDLAAVPPLLQNAGVKLPPDVTDGLGGSMLARAELSGTIERPLARIEIEARDLRARALPQAMAIDARLDVDSKGLRAQRVEATAGTMSLVASGTYGWSGPFDARVELTDGNLSELAKRYGVPATVSGSARVEGTVRGTISGSTRSGQAELVLVSQDLAVEGISIGQLTARGTVPLAEGSVMTVDAAAPGVGARGRFEIVNRTGYPVSGEVTLDHDGIGALIPASYRQQVGELTGALSITARGSGPLSDPAQIRGRVDLRRLDLVARGTPVRLAAPASFTVTDDRIAADSLDLHVGQRARATVAGQLGVTTLSNPLRIRLDGPISELIEIGSRTAGIAPVAVRGEGTATLDVTVDGTLGHPLPAGRLAVQSPSLEYGSLAPISGLVLTADIDPTLITLRSVAAGWQSAALTGSGTLPWRVVLASLAQPDRSTLQSSRLAGWLNALPAEPARARLTLRADNLTPELLKGVLTAEQLEAMQGNASATVEAEADRLSLEGVQATTVLERASLTLAGVPFTQSAPTRLRLENGRARIEEFRWSAEGNSIVASGGADLTSAEPTLDVTLAGALDLRAAGAFLTGIATGGTANADLRITGLMNDPDIAGSITIADGEVQLDSPRLAATDFKGTLQVGAGRTVTVSLAGSINTGNATVDGTIGLADLAAPLGKLQLVGRNVALEYPSGFQTESDVNLELALTGATSTLTGRIDVLDGTYREALVITTQLLSLSSTSGIVGAAPPADWLSRLRFDVAVATARDVQIDNNYGRFDMGASLRLVGTAASPGVIGRIQAADGGEIFLGGNTYRIERLSIDLANPRAISPDVNFVAQTRVGDLPINVELRCPAAAPCERKVTSLSSGDDAEAEARLFGTGGGAAAAGEGLARLVSGEFLGVVSRRVGLDTIRLEQGAENRDIFDDPTLISGDVDPAARLTLAKRLGSNVELIFSQNLADDGFTWITSYLGPRGLSWRVLLLDDQSRSYEFRHEPSLGVKSKPRTRPPGPRIQAVMIAGDPGFSEKEVRRQLKLTEGDRFAFGDWQRDRDRLERFYQSEGFLEARIRARRLVDIPEEPEAAESVADGVGLEYRITRGPATAVAIRGVTLPEDVRDRIQARWTSALFDGFLERDARTIVRDHVYRQGHLNATIATSITQDPARQLKTLTIDVTPGSVVPSRIDVTGNSALPTEQLLGLVTTLDSLSPWLDPGSVERLLENHYRAEGYLAADVSVGRPEIRDGASVVTIKAVEGAPYSIGRVELSGLPDLPDQNVADELTFKSGDRYRPAGVAAGIERLEARLRQTAYRQASTNVDTRVDAGAGRVDIAIGVTPGPRAILRDVVVQGGDAAKPMVAKSIVLTPDAPLDPDALRETRRRLYDLDVYRSVDIDVQPVPSSAPSSAEAAPSGTPIDQPVVATITLEERPRYRLRYGLAVSDEEIGPDERDRRLGFAADFENRNIFGRGMSAGLSLRLRRDQRVVRGTLGARRLFGFPLRSTLFVERERELLNPEGAFPTTSDITSFTGEQAYRFQRPLELRYGYGIERNHTFIRDEASPFDLTVTIARFTTSGLVDRRDDAFNPVRGWFAASSLEYSTPGIGSDLKFLKDFAQYMHFVSPARGLVVASAARFGVARTFGDTVLIPSERFYAGGANTVRGYREDDLGARSILDDAEGGSALLVFNGELRFPIYRWLKGVGFVDLGNVYPKVSEITFGDFQVGVGAGARFDTPVGLIRLDLGIPANPRPFDPRWRLHVGLGHAF